MKKAEAYYSTLSVYCQWAEDTEECSAYKQSCHHRVFYRTDQFSNWHRRIYHANKLITIWQQVQQCLQHFTSQISWICEHI